MKIICLNTWGGVLKDELRDFLIKQSTDTNIFCFQEVYDRVTNPRKVVSNIDCNLLANLREWLPEYNNFYAPQQDNDKGLAIFAKQAIDISEIGDEFVYRHKNAMINDDSETIGSNVQFLKFKQNKKDYTVINFHGFWSHEGKVDTKNRILQSQKIVDFIKTKTSGEVILCGDFNLGPNTKSIAMIDDCLCNLIKKYNISGTRSKYYEKQDKFADYVFVSNGINISKFKILSDQVSDHLPIMLEFI